MIAKSDDLRRSLCEIDRLLQSLRAAGAYDEIALKEIEVLERSRQSIVNLLEARQRQSSSAIVSLRAWRDGDLATLPPTAERFGATARATHPRRGRPRLFCVS